MKLNLSVDGEVKIKAILDFDDTLKVSATVTTVDSSGKRVSSSFNEFSKESLKEIEKVLKTLHEEVVNHPQLGQLVRTNLQHAGSSGFAVKVGGKTNV